MFYCLCSGVSSVTVSNLWKVKNSFDENIVYDAVIVLAGVIQPGDERITGDTDWDFSFHGNSNRLIAGIKFVKTGHAKSLLVGNQPLRLYNEGPVVRRFAEYQGLRKDQIKIYGDVRRTVDEANGVKIFLDARNYKNVILITREIHMRRALALFNRAGVFPDTFSVDSFAGGVRWEHFIPTVGAVSNLTNFLYELFGYVAYYMKGDI